MTNPLSGFGSGLFSSIMGVDFGNSPSPSSKGSGSKASSSTSQYQTTTQGGKGSSDGDAGNTLLSTLSLPNGLNAWSPFTWQVNRQVSKGNTPGNAIMGPFMPGHNPNVSTLTQMTMAGAMSYLRELAVQGQGNPNSDYNGIVHQLVAAGYLSPTEARYGSFTNKVANAFLQSAADVWSVNSRGGEGQLLTWFDHINSMIQSRQAAGLIDENGLPVGSGGSSGPQAPTRTDTFSNPEDVKAAINGAAENILGRRLTDSEASAFQSVFHGMEQKFNDQKWSATLASFNNQSSTPNASAPVTQAPSPSSAAENYMDDSPAFGQERTTQLLGSYMGVLRGMTGLGSGGVSRAVS